MPQWSPWSVTIAASTTSFAGGHQRHICSAARHRIVFWQRRRGCFPRVPHGLNRSAPQSWCQPGALPARTVTVALRWGEVTLIRPATAPRRLPQTVAMRVVDVAEVDVAGPNQVHWCPLTTHAAESLVQAGEIVRWYQARWTIEPMFRTLKSAGTQAETSQVAEARRFVKLAVTALIAAVRIVQIVIARDAATEQPISDVADPQDAPMLQAFNAKLEGRTARLKNPHDPATLAWFAWIVARLGGWSGYTSKGYKPAGPKTIARRLIKLDGMTRGWNLAHSCRATAKLSGPDA